MVVRHTFRDRADAGRQLAERVGQLELEAPLVLGLPRGGVPVAAEVAAALHAPWDVFVACKIGAPGHQEMGIGAVAEGLDEPLASPAARYAGIGPEDLRMLAGHVRREVARRVALYRGDRPFPEVADRDIVVVDDGLATGVTAEAALVALRPRHPRRLTLAAPVCSLETAGRLGEVADDVVCVEVPARFLAVAYWYANFEQYTDEDVLISLCSRGGPADGC